MPSVLSTRSWASPVAPIHLLFRFAPARFGANSPVRDLLTASNKGNSLELSAAKADSPLRPELALGPQFFLDQLRPAILLTLGLEVESSQCPGE